MKQTSRNSENPTMSAAAAPKKITADIPAALNERVETVLQCEHTTMSAFIRDALESYVTGFERTQLDRSLEEGALANADLDREICREFEFADADVNGL